MPAPMTLPSASPDFCAAPTTRNLAPSKIPLFRVAAHQRNLAFPKIPLLQATANPRNLAFLEAPLFWAAANTRNLAFPKISLWKNQRRILAGFSSASTYLHSAFLIYLDLSSDEYFAPPV